jgi:hypothetical protein
MNFKGPIVNYENTMKAQIGWLKRFTYTCTTVLLQSFHNTQDKEPYKYRPSPLTLLVVGIKGFNIHSEITEVVIYLAYTIPFTLFARTIRSMVSAFYRKHIT